MMTFSQMMGRVLLALVLGALMGLEREAAGKEAGIRTSMLVAAGSAIFSIIGLSLPYLIALSPQNLADVMAHNSGFLGAVANIVVGVGFLGAGIIIKTHEHVHGLTTAALVWAVAAVGTLAGIGLGELALASAVLITGLLYILRKAGLAEYVRPKENENGESGLGS